MLELLKKAKSFFAVKSLARLHFISIFSSLFFFLLCPISFAAEDISSKRVLVLGGYTDLGPWEQNFNSILLRQFSTELGVKVTPEFLPLIDIADDTEKLQLLADSMRMRLSATGQQYDLVIAVQPEATNFLANWGESLFPEASRLYVLPGPTLATELGLQADNIIHSATPVAIDNTIKLISRLLPRLENVIVVGGAGVGDQTYLTRIETAYSQYETDVELHFLSGLKIEALIETLQSQPDSSAILMGNYNRDVDGNMLRAVDVTAALSEAVALPLFVIFEDLVGPGAVGGNVTGSTSYALQTVDFGAAILRGETYTPHANRVSSYVFDGQQLQRFSIPHRLLPDGSMLVNYELSPWQQYFWEIMLAFSIIAVLLVLLIALYRSSRLRQRAERELREAQKLEALGIFSSGIAHDFNNILMAIDGNAELVEMYLHNDLEKAKSSLNSIATACDRAKHLISQILMFSRTSKGEKPQTIDLKNMLNECASMVRASTRGDIEVSASISNELWMIGANETKIQQIVMNLCSNARDAIEGSGSITLSAINHETKKNTRLTGGLMPSGQYVSITLTDTGSGISEENISRIFEPFFTTKALRKGTGLGLSIVHGIVREFGGYLHVQSKLGRGTSIAMFFPASIGAVKPVEVKKEVSWKRGNGENILLVDDDEMVLKSTANILGNLGYKVSAHQNSNSALQIFSCDPNAFDIVFTDMSMSDHNGIELILRLKALRSDLPAILCTGNPLAIEDFPEEIRRQFSLLKKPNKMSEMAEKIAEVLKSQ